MEKIVIDASGVVFGRLCSYVAKEILSGKEVCIINSEKTILTGDAQMVLEKFRNMRAKGGKAHKGPYYPRAPYKILKRGIRGMLPNFREGIGREALDRVKCYDGVPKELENNKTIKIKSQTKQKFVSLEEISEKI